MGYDTALLLALFLLGLILMVSAVQGNTGTYLCSIASPAHITSS